MFSTIEGSRRADIKSKIQQTSPLGASPAIFGQLTFYIYHVNSICCMCVIIYQYIVLAVMPFME